MGAGVSGLFGFLETCHFERQVHRIGGRESLVGRERRPVIVLMQQRALNRELGGCGAPRHSRIKAQRTNGLHNRKSSFILFWAGTALAGSTRSAPFVVK